MTHLENIRRKKMAVVIPGLGPVVSIFYTDAIWKSSLSSIPEILSFY
jgi:hypothetical protein